MFSLFLWIVSVALILLAQCLERLLRF